MVMSLFQLTLWKLIPPRDLGFNPDRNLQTEKKPVSQHLWRSVTRSVIYTELMMVPLCDKHREDWQEEITVAMSLSLNFKDSTLGILSNQNLETQKILTLKKETILLEKSYLWVRWKTKICRKAGSSDHPTVFRLQKLSLLYNFQAT